MADDMHYASMCVFHEITSKTKYIDYLSAKLRTLKAHDVHVEFEIVRGERCAIL